MHASHVRVALVLAMVLLPISALADEATLLIESHDVLSVVPKMDGESLFGRTVWIGDAQGARGTAVLQPKPNHPNDVVLDRTVGAGLFLAYTKPTEFLTLTPRKIQSGRVFDAVTERLKIFDANISSLQVEELTHADLDADGRTDTIVSAHTTRNPDDTFTLKSGDIEAVVLVIEPNGQPEIMDHIVFLPLSPSIGLPHLEVLTIARNPSDQSWNFLVSEEYRKPEWAETTIAGPSATSRVSSKLTKLLLYELRDRRFSTVDGLRKWLESR